MDRGAWWATVHGVAKSRTRLSDFTLPLPLPAETSTLAWKIPWTEEPGRLLLFNTLNLLHLFVLAEERPDLSISKCPLYNHF